MIIKYCKQCGSELKDESGICAECGASQKSAFCGNCGNKLNADDVFCSKCGKSINNEQNNQPAAPNPIKDVYRANPQLKADYSNLSAHTTLSVIGMVISIMTLFVPWLDIGYGLEMGVFDIRDGSWGIIILISLVLIFISLFINTQTKKTLSVIGFLGITFSQVTFLYTMHNDSLVKYYTEAITAAPVILLMVGILATIIGLCIPCRAGNHRRPYTYTKPRPGNTCKKCGTLNSSSVLRCMECGEALERSNIPESEEEEVIIVYPESMKVAVFSFVLGILSIFSFRIVMVLQCAQAIIAIVLGVKGRKKENGRKLATAGLVLGIIGLVLFVVVMLIESVHMGFSGMLRMLTGLDL